MQYQVRGDKTPASPLTEAHTGVMDRDGRHPRRLRVSALAAVANPSYSRIDTWNLLDDACHQLAVVDRAGMDTAHEAARVRRLLNRLSAYERYWIYPGPENLATYCGYLDQLATVSLAEQVSLAVRLLSEYGDRAALVRHLLVAGRSGAGRAGQGAAVLHRAARRRRPGHRARRPGGKPARDSRRRRRRAVRAAGGLQRRGRHHRGRAERGDPGRDHPRTTFRCGPTTGCR